MRTGLLACVLEVMNDKTSELKIYLNSIGFAPILSVVVAVVMVTICYTSGADTGQQPKKQGCND